MRNDLSQLKKEEKAESRREEKERLRARIDNLHERLHSRLIQAKQRMDRQEEETKAKVQSLEKRAAKSNGDAKAAIKARIDSIRKKSTKSTENFEQMQKS